MLTVIKQRLTKYTAYNINRVFNRFSDKNIFYFAYGANMNEEILRSNHIHSQTGTIGCLKDYKISISLPCEYVEKGFASVEPFKDSKVYGIIWQISKLDLAILDVCEWVSFNYYRREQVEIESADGTITKAYCYTACNPRTNLKTSLGYLNLLVDSAIKMKLPESYIDELKKLPHSQNFPLDHTFNLSNPEKKRFQENRLEKLYKIHDKIREKLCNYLP